MSVVDFGIGRIFQRPKEAVVKKGDCIIIACWRWWPPGYQRRIVCVNEEGNVTVTPL